MDRLTLTQDQLELLHMLLYAKEKESQLSILANSIDEPIYEEESSYLKERASIYDFVYWEALGKLTGETMNSFISNAELAIEKVEARAKVYGSKKFCDRFTEVERETGEDLGLGDPTLEECLLP